MDVRMKKWTTPIIYIRDPAGFLKDYNIF